MGLFLFSHTFQPLEIGSLGNVRHGGKKKPSSNWGNFLVSSFYSAKETAQGVVASAPDSETWEAGTTKQPNKQTNFNNMPKITQ